MCFWTFGFEMKGFKWEEKQKGWCAFSTKMGMALNNIEKMDNGWCQHHASKDESF